MTSERVRILLVCVNYNSYPELEKYLESIVISHRSEQGRVILDILVADNSEGVHTLPEFSNAGIRLFFFSNEGNPGYLGGIDSSILKSGVKLPDYDFLIMSNVDLILSDTFFSRLLNLDIAENIGWIAPAVISVREGRDRNPKIIARPTKRKMKLLSLMYRFPLLHMAYSKIIYSRHHKSEGIASGTLIYAAHGSFMLFTRSFAGKYEPGSFRSFLFGEEIYFAEQLRHFKLKTVYKPEIVVRDIDHVSTSRIRKRNYYRMNLNSINYLRKEYF